MADDDVKAGEDIAAEDGSTTVTPLPVFSSLGDNDDSAEIASQRRAITKNEVLDMWGFIRDRDHYRRLEELCPDDARMVALAVEAGWTPEEIRRWALDRGENAIMAVWFKQAADYLVIEGESA